MTGNHAPPPPAPHGNRLAAAAVVAGIVALACADWYFGLTFNAAILYSALVLVCWWHRSVRFVWAMAAAAVVLTVVVGVLEPTEVRAFVHRSAAIVSIIASATLLHALFKTQDRVQEHEEALSRRNEALEASNRELAAREEEIARQNEELQSQAEELERQSEELRSGNEELIGREHTLETLLALSRALSADLTREQTMTKVCEALSQLANGRASAAAILEQVDDLLVVRCHTGFGDEGLESDRVPLAQSFASLALSRGRTAYIEDIALRPDLHIAQPRQGPPMVSVLAVPLRVGGWPVGTLELYSTRKTAWSEEQVALAESLAAQMSVSLEAAALFGRVEGERKRLKTVLEVLPVGVMIAEDAVGTRMTGNAAMAALYQAPSDANFSPLPGAGTVRRGGFRRNGQPVAPEDLPLMRALRTGKTVAGEELELVLPDNRTIVALINAAPFFDASGRVVGGVGVVVDVTGMKALQRELDARRREAEEASVRKTRFLAAVSHDIRTPANAISLLAELIRRTAANPALVTEVPELAREMHESAMSLVNLLGDVLDVARFDSGKIEIQESDVSVGELLAEEYRRMQPLAREKGLSLEFAPPPEPVTVRADRIKLSRVIGNLLGNAIKFTKEGSVRLEACRDGDGWADIRVADTGIGIAPQHQSHIFDEFFQLGNPERDRNKGTGLGLAICKRLVDAMGGRISLVSTPGKGSTFTVSLPPAGAPVGQPLAP